MDASYESLVSSLPPGLRPQARGLPHRLGMARSPDSGWQEVISLHPNRELPLYAAELGGGRARAPDQVLPFVRAHHYGGFAWLLRDRIADGQLAADGSLIELGRVLADRWQRSLVDASGDAGLARWTVDAVTARWTRAVSGERRVLAAGGVRPAVYAALVRDKLRWIAAPSVCLLLGGGPLDEPEARARQDRARAFQRAYDLFLLGLQAIDDVNDAEEDRGLYGRDVAGALGCSAGALLRIAPKLCRRASAVAAGAGFSRLAFWLGAFGRAIAPLNREGDQLGDELDAIAIAGEMEQLAEEDADGEDLPPAAPPWLAPPVYR